MQWLVLYTMLTLCNCQAFNGAVYLGCSTIRSCEVNQGWIQKLKGWETTEVTGMAQLIAIVVLVGNSALIKIHVANEKGIRWERHF